MAKNRVVNTKFWTDNFVLDELNPVEKLVFIYLITNPYTDICGIYEISLKIMAIETGIDRDNLEKVILPKFEKSGKVAYRNGWIAIKNFIKHQSINPSVQKGIEEGLKKAPTELKLFIDGQPLTASDSLLHTDSIQIISNTDSIQIRERGDKSPTPAEQAKNFFNSKEKQIEVLLALQNKYGQKDLMSSEMKKFIDYWTERNKSGTKQRWEMEKTFEVGRRMAKWLNNIKQFQGFKSKDNLPKLIKI